MAFQVRGGEKEPAYPNLQAGVNPWFGKSGGQVNMNEKQDLWAVWQCVTYT
jgi:hypothetical protein